MSQPVSPTWDRACSWRLSRQHVLPRMDPGGLPTVDQNHVGIHAKVLPAGELALWARLEELLLGAAFQALREQRSLVNTWAIRRTLHSFDAPENPRVAAA